MIDINRGGKKKIELNHQTKQNQTIYFGTLQLHIFCFVLYHIKHRLVLNLHLLNYENDLCYVWERFLEGSIKLNVSSFLVYVF
jgi:hypothetical protein